MPSWSDMEEFGSLASSGSRGPTVKVVDSPQQVAIKSAVDGAYANMKPSETQEAIQEIRTISEAERRIRKANCYQAIIDNQFFDDDASDEAIEVEDEMREYAMHKLRVMLGIEQEKSLRNDPDFDKEQVLALRTWADKILERKPGSERKAEKVEKQQEVHVRKTVAEPKVAPEPTVRMVRDPNMKRRGRPPKTQETAPLDTNKVAKTPAPLTKKVIEKEVVKADGTVGVVEMDVTGPAQPQGVYRAPPPVYSPNQISQADMMESNRVSQVGDPMVKLLENMTRR